MGSVLKYSIIKCIPVVLAAGILFSCRNDIEEIKAITSKARLPVQTSYNSEFYFTEDGRVKNKLEATKFERYMGENPLVRVTGGFVLTIFDSTEQVEAEISAKNGVFYEEKNRMEARNNVTLSNVQGDTLSTEELIWLQDSGKVYTEKFVTISTNKGVIYGQGMESNESFTSYRIKKPVGDLYIQENSDTNAREIK
jgi:LPS export ABC transporter protein LptC